MRKLAIAAGTGAVLVLLTSAPAFAGSAPRVRHVGNTVDVTRSGKSVTISAEYRCSGVATTTATVTQSKKNAAGAYVVTSVYRAGASSAVCNGRYHSYAPKVTKTSGAALTTTGRTVVTVTLTVSGGPTLTKSGTATVVSS